MVKDQNPLYSRNYAQIHRKLLAAQKLRLDAIHLLQDMDWKKVETAGARAKLSQLGRKVYSYPGDITVAMLVKVYEVLAREKEEEEG